jgi:hypothetical protein
VPARIVRIDATRVVHDVNDGEVLAIRSDTGTYYSMDGTAAVAWQAIDAGADEPAIIDELAARYAAERSTVALAVADFLDQLLHEQLVTLSEAPAAATQATEVHGEPLPWQAPVVQVYTDMQDLLLFDPIHEVGPEGWPNIADDAR